MPVAQTEAGDFGKTVGNRGDLSEPHDLLAAPFDHDLFEVGGRLDAPDQADALLVEITLDVADRRRGVLPAQGTYVLNVDLAASGIDEPDRAFALRAVKDAGVASIPVSALYEEDQVTTILRLCLAKNDQTLDEGVRRLAKARDLSRRA